jgi:hypothetical protein
MALAPGATTPTAAATATCLLKNNRQRIENQPLGARSPLERCDLFRNSTGRRRLSRNRKTQEQVASRIIGRDPFNRVVGHGHPPLLPP